MYKLYIMYIKTIVSISILCIAWYFFFINIDGTVNF